jgi:hypothetical protein
MQNKRMSVSDMWYIEVGVIFHMQLSFRFYKHIRLMYGLDTSVNYKLGVHLLHLNFVT